MPGWARELVGERLRAVARAVVDGDDLERLGDGRQALERLLDEALDVRLLVVGREEVRQGDAGAAWGRGAVISRARGPTTRESGRSGAVDLSRT